MRNFVNINDAFSQDDQHALALPQLPKTKPQLLELCRTKLDSAKKAITVLKNDSSKSKDSSKMIALIQSRITELESAEAKLNGLKDKQEAEAEPEQQWKTATYQVPKNKKAAHKCNMKEH